MNKKQRSELIAMAKEARTRSYSPYSNFSVGAALLCKNGKIYKGCNVENAAYSPTCCAERVALFSAIADGEREFSSIAIVGNASPCMPCGVCRQVMAELCPTDLEIVYEDPNGESGGVTLGELLPFGFKLK